VPIDAGNGLLCRVRPAPNAREFTDTFKADEMKLSNFAPKFLKQSGLYQRLSRQDRIRRLRRRMAGASPLNVVVGAGETEFPGWFNTDCEILNIASPRDWARLFTSETIDRLLSEHVLEHISEGQARIALTECYRYLKPGGVLRAAVPDGYRGDASYVAEVSPPNHGHQELYNVDTFTALLESAGFVVTPLEYFDAGKNFRAQPWDENEGKVMRSLRFDSQAPFQRDQMFYSSLIVDARKL
jgi:predicted SAM-dependent methyltransferase